MILINDSFKNFIFQVKLITNKPIKPTKTRTIRKDSKNKTFKPIRLYTCKTEKV